MPDNTNDDIIDDLPDDVAHAASPANTAKPAASPAHSNDERMQELITEIARVLVDAPLEVAVEAISLADATTLRLRVAPADVGKVIGKQGRTVRSLRTILGAVSVKSQHRYTLDILEGDRAPRGHI